VAKRETSPDYGDKQKRISPQAQYRLDRRLRTALVRVVGTLHDIAQQGGRVDVTTGYLAAAVHDLLRPYFMCGLPGGGECGTDKLDISGFPWGEVIDTIRTRRKETGQRYRRHRRAVLGEFFSPTIAQDATEWP
jgi:hypothetical protein